MTKTPTFQARFLHPRYWLLLLGIGLLYILTLLPYPIIYWMGTRLGRLSRHLLKSRVNIADRNLALCFPNMSLSERQKLIQQNFESVGMGIFETGMAWFWPDWRIQRWFTIKGRENIQQAQQTGRGILVIGVHFLTLELGARIFGILNPGIGVYRPNDNPLLDWLQAWGRVRSNKSVIDRKDVKGMVRNLKQGEILWYAPDHDYGPKNSVFAPFFAVDKAATTVGTSILLRLANPLIIPFTPRRLSHAQGYELIIQPAVEDFPMKDEVTAAALINQVVEKEIMQAPDQYMWLHRRFKTRPPGEPSLYGKLDKLHD
ncbi:Kdo(2)-lipid IV(A) acyltransferase [Moellerella wisconsensis]|uniref:Kdo(2)-lipid IV(A) acyltransferase n=1 Tax=Moellerella wisconsensis TaxID=158849 RepID=UPI003076747D